MPGLNQLIEVRNKKAGGTRVMQGFASMRTQKRCLIDFPRLPTYVTPLDFALAGGLPLNTMTQVFGPYNGGKSTLAYLAARAVSHTCFRCLQPIALCRCKEGVDKRKTFLCQAEGLPPDELWFHTLKYNPDENLVIGLPESGEEACAMLEDAVRADDCGLVILDSLATLLPKEEAEAEYTDDVVGRQAKLITRFTRRMQPLLVREFSRGHNVAVLVLNQLRASIGGGKYEEAVAGGYAAKHAFRLSMRVSQLSPDKDAEKDKNLDMKNVLRFSVSLLGNVAKQQMLMLAGKCEYKLVVREYENYEQGTVLDANTVLSLAKEHSTIAKGSKHYDLRGTNMGWRTQADIVETMRTGQYASPTTGEVLVSQGVDDLLRFKVVQDAKQSAVRRITQRMQASIQQIQTSQQLADQTNEGGEPGESCDGTEA